MLANSFQCPSGRPTNFRIEIPRFDYLVQMADMGGPFVKPLAKLGARTKSAARERCSSSLRGAKRRSNPERPRGHRKPPGLLRFARNDEKHLSPLRGERSSEARVRGRCRESERSRSSASAIHNDQSSGSAYAPSPRPSPRVARRGSGTGTRRIAGLSLRIVMRARRPCASRRPISVDRLPGGTGNSRTIWRS